MSIDQQRLVQWLEAMGLQLLAVALILLAGVWLARRISAWLGGLLTRAGAEPTLANFLRNASYGALLIVVAVAALQKLGVPITSMVAVLGAAGLAIGLAVKDSLSNIASGLMLIVMRPFRSGDYVQAGGMEGTVEQIRVFQTRLRTADNRLIVLPNSMVTSAAIVNFTANPRRRAEVALTVGYRDDLERVRETMLAIAAGHPNVLDDPAPVVLATAMGEAGVTLTLQCWLNTHEYGSAYSALLRTLREKLVGRTLATPRRDLHVFHHRQEDETAPEAEGELLARGAEDARPAGS